nr:hypothetical protein Itr_chr15CG12810 [Ipomoea trifida]
MEASRWTSKQERKRQTVQQGRVNGARGSDGSGGGVGHRWGPRPLPGPGGRVRRSIRRCVAIFSAVGAAMAEGGGSRLLLERSARVAG